MANPFVEHPILNSPYACPQRHWELDDQGQPTQRLIETRRRAEFITPIPKPKKRKAKASPQKDIVFDEGLGLSTQDQQYDPTSIRRLTGRFLPVVASCHIVNVRGLLACTRLHRLAVNSPAMPMPPQIAMAVGSGTAAGELKPYFWSRASQVCCSSVLLSSRS